MEWEVKTSSSSFTHTQSHTPVCVSDFQNVCLQYKYMHYLQICTHCIFFVFTWWILLYMPSMPSSLLISLRASLHSLNRCLGPHFYRCILICLFYLIVSLSGYLSCFSFLAIRDNDTIHVVLPQYLHIDSRITVGSISWSRIAGAKLCVSFFLK